MNAAVAGDEENHISGDEDAHIRERATDGLEDEDASGASQGMNRLVPNRRATDVLEDEDAFRSGEEEAGMKMLTSRESATDGLED